MNLKEMDSEFLFSEFDRCTYFDIKITALLVDDLFCKQNLFLKYPPSRYCSFKNGIYIMKAWTLIMAIKFVHTENIFKHCIEKICQFK